MSIKRHEIVSLVIAAALFAGGWAWWQYEPSTPANAAEPAWLLGAQGEIYVVEADSVIADDGEAAWGEADYSRRQITIERGLPEGFRGQVVRHERCHFALSDMHVRLREFIADSVNAQDLEERICDAIAAGFRE